MVLHSCDNPACVNPAHLSVGDGIANAADAVSKKRHAYGERNKGGGKLTWDDVRMIRTLAPLGPARLARCYGVSTTTIKAINRNGLWQKHLAP
jgi:DNA-binding transcriptional regulator YiaG